MCTQPKARALNIVNKWNATTALRPTRTKAQPQAVVVAVVVFENFKQEQTKVGGCPLERTGVNVFKLLILL